METNLLNRNYAALGGSFHESIFKNQANIVEDHYYSLDDERLFTRDATAKKRCFRFPRH